MIATTIGTPTTLYAALDEPNADVDLILGQIADWYEERGDCWRAECLQWCRSEGKRPERNGWGYDWWASSGGQTPSNVGYTLYYSGAAASFNTIGDAYARLALAWHTIRERGEHPTPPPAPNRPGEP